MRQWIDDLEERLHFGMFIFCAMKFDIAEIMNLRHLERVLAREEEVKKRAVVHKAVYSGPQTRYLSRNGKHFFITCQYFSSWFSFSKECEYLPLVEINNFYSPCICHSFRDVFWI